MVLLNSNIFIVLYIYIYIALVLYSKLWASFERHFPSLRVVYPTLKFCKVMFLNISRKIHVLITKINCKALLRIFYFTLSEQVLMCSFLIKVCFEKKMDGF